jgi:hypothetical protein
MLEKNGGGEGIDIAAPASRRSVHVANGTLGCGRRESFIDEADRQAGPPRDLGSYRADFDRSWRVIALLIERKPEDESPGIDLVRPRDDLCDRGTLSRTAEQESRRRCNRPAWITDRESDSAVSIIDRQQASS